MEEITFKRLLRWALTSLIAVVVIEITFKRLLRWTLASLIVVIAVAYGFGIGIASAESGTFTIQEETHKTYSDLSTGCAGAGYTLSTANFRFYNTLYERPLYIKIISTQFGFSGQSGYTDFYVSSGGTGTGTFAYDKNRSSLEWWFDDTSDLGLTSNPFVLAYSNITLVDQVNLGTICGSLKSVSADYPILLGGNAGKTSDWNYDVIIHDEIINGYNVTYPNTGFFNVFVNKSLSPISTKWVVSDSNNQLTIESAFDAISKNIYYGEQLNEIYLNMTLSNGLYHYQVINFTGVSIIPTATPVINPITGVGIIFDYADYSVGDIANITWSRIINTPSGDTDFIVAIHPDGTEEELISSPPDTGNYKVLMSPAGTWKVEFRRSSWLFGISVLDSDTATVGAETPSYIYAPANVATGKLFNVTYRIGFTPTANAWIKTYRWMGSDWIYEQAFSATGAKNVETNTSILIKDTGKYLIKLCDVIQGCKASTSTTGYFNGTEPTLNITVSNITTDKAAYSYGEYIATNVYVDNSNWSNKAISVDYLNYDTGITNNQQYVQSQVESFNLFVSDLVFPASGNSALRLIGKNDTGNYVLAFKNFTLSSLDAEGYGLSVIGNPTCKGSTGQIKVVVPAGEVANLSISADNAIYNKEYVMNGSKIVPYTFPISGAYYVTLRVNSEAKRLIIVNIGDCTVPANTTWQGQGQITNACSFWDGWVGNLAGGQGINDLTRFEFALLVIGMITAFTTIITKNLGAGIITGFFPYAFFVFLSLSTPCGQYMPVWTAVFIALIVGIKMRWFN